MMESAALGKAVNVPKSQALEATSHTWSAMPPCCEDLLRRDSGAANLQRSIERFHRCAKPLIGMRRLGVYRDDLVSSTRLEKAGMVHSEPVQRLREMVGFQNLLVHEVQEIDETLLEGALTHRFEDLHSLGSCAVRGISL